MRIRSIKPEFWRSDDVNAMCLEDRLLFIGLWSYVDDNGVGIDRQSDICADLFAHDLSVSPHDTLMRVQAGLNRLSELGVIRRYTVSGKRFLEIVNWSKHQRINRPSPGRFPTSDGVDVEIHAPLTEDSLRTHEGSLPGAGEQGNRGTGEETPLAQSADADVRETDRFDEFWNVYNKKRDRKRAEQKWKSALKKKGVTPDILIDSARAYITRQVEAGKHPEFTKDAHTWLNGENWNDEAPSNVAQLHRDRPRRNGLAFVPTCPTCSAPPENVHDPECPDQSWRPNTEGIGT